MERELLRTLFSIKDKTGIDVTVVSESGLHYASTRAEYDVIPLKIFHGETVQFKRFAVGVFSLDFGQHFGGIVYAAVDFAGSAVTQKRSHQF